MELAALLEGKQPRVLDLDVDLDRIDYDVDVLVIGGGGAGSSAAIEAHEAGANVMIVTKLRMGDANTMMAEGGIQAADKAERFPGPALPGRDGRRTLSSIVPELVRKLVMDGPGAIKWLNELGVEFDKARGRHDDYHPRRRNLPQAHARGGGLFRRRDHAHAARRGAATADIPVVDFTAAIELILDDERQGRGRGAAEHGDRRGTGGAREDA